ncbi:NAD(P)H dehydrogenase (quinone) [Paractinoplanes brasiliensis]|uniref:NAD(P)H dehydrogenase (Quinone) n=1 Tax=Paractinoplanes brasiliensis TaxID=52695 RepID=A0A4R6JYT4_9ACTN|nr:NAD(P)H:quinone oxidoreductase [Actinoplanes brasiliensis]TDO40891.1 NAD(P)H dehydrogenase (quinone) [Actinoplanes brasiliensis]GID25959.1 NAD(P)H:quinone oxidoreductase type IV [Actinoplanes brasiliensis]
MADVRLSIIYYSSTGTLHKMAERLREAGEKAGAEVRLRQVAELAPAEAIASNAAWSQHFDRTKDEPKATADDVTWADAVLFGTPTRYGNVASQLKQFLDTLGPQWAQGQLADKAYAGFTATMTAHGGQESTLLALYNTIHHFGGIVVAPGYTDPLKFTDGNPYGVSHVTGGNNDAPLGDAEYAALDHLAQRIVRIASKLKSE